MQIRVNKRFLGATIAVVTVFIMSAVEAAQRVRFARGTSGTTLEASIARGETRSYLLGARAGQTMEVSLVSREDNAVFQIYRPNGRAVPGARPGDDTTFWRDTLPQSGDYRIEVGSVRGGANYALSISIIN